MILGVVGEDFVGGVVRVCVCVCVFVRVLVGRFCFPLALHDEEVEGID